MRRVVLLVLLVAACAGESDDPAAVGSTSSSVAHVTGPSVQDVRSAAVGTVACPGEDCTVVEDVTVDGEELRIATGLYPDADADAPGKALCVVGVGMWEGPVVVVGSEGTTLASGRRDRTPICA